MRRVVLVLGTLLLAACAPEEEDPCVHDPPLAWENFGEGFVDQYCTGCHSSNIPRAQRNGAPEGYDFDAYEGVLLWADRIQIRVEEGTMPPGGGPHAEELLLFSEWMACEVMPDAEEYWYGDDE